MSEVKKRLEAWEKREGLTPQEAARRLGYSPKMYEAIKYGYRRPRLSRAKEFQEMTGVPASLFFPEMKGLM
jgi:transcriptional regulator with XRE-family HTH domain